MPESGATADSPRVSILMPLLNMERFLAESIESVLAQTYPRWELLIIDDGSTDSGPAIARSFAQEHPSRVFYVEHPERANLGASASRNLGLTRARGEWIAMLDSDDLWLPHKLEQQILLVDAHPEVDFLYGNTLWWYGWTGTPSDRARDRIPPLGFPPNTILQPPELLSTFMSGRAAVPATCSVLIRRSVIDRVGGFEEDFRYIFTDHVFYTKVLLEATVMVTDGCWDVYRRHPTSSYSSVEQAGEFDAKRLAWLHWTRDYLSARQLKGTGLWQVLQAQLRRYREPRKFALSTALRKFPQRAKHTLSKLGRRVLPGNVRKHIRVSLLPRWRPRPGEVNFGSFARVTPIGRLFDPERGSSVERFYVEEFVALHGADLTGQVLGVGRSIAGGSSPVAAWRSDSRHATSSEEVLAAAPSESRDAVLQWGGVWDGDLTDLMRHVCRVLRPGGVYIAAFPAMARYGAGEAMHAGEPALTAHQVRCAAEAVFGADQVRVVTRGNVLSACAILHGLAVEELSVRQLAYYDPSYPVVLLLRAVRGGAS